MRGDTARGQARGGRSASCHLCASIWASPGSATFRRSPTPSRRIGRAAAPSRPGRWASCCARAAWSRTNRQRRARRARNCASAPPSERRPTGRSTMLLKDEIAETKVAGRRAKARRAEPAERARLAEDARGEVSWKLWGPYLSERQWGTVREDYSPYGNAWEYFPHDQARSRAYRWGEDGIAGISDRSQRLCLALALVERQGPDPEGAAVRPDQRRGQSQRGRQGAVLLSRRHADPLVPEISLQVSAARISLQLAGRREPPARQGAARVRADRYRRVRRRPLFRRVRRIRQGRRPKTS